MIKLALILIIECLSFLGFNQERIVNNELVHLRIENNLKISNTYLTFGTSMLKVIKPNEWIHNEAHVNGTHELKNQE